MAFSIINVKYKGLSYHLNFSKKLILTSLGGNAFDNSKNKDLLLEKQSVVVKNSLKGISKYMNEDRLVAIVHGNGPQVGMLQKLTGSSLLTCSKLSQLVMGEQITRALDSNKGNYTIRDFKAKVIPTEVEVDMADKEFQNPTKFIGSFLDEKMHDAAKKENPSWIFKYVENKGWRRVVPSPLPKKILQLDEIMYFISQGYCVISTGGGGVPVYNKGNDSYGHVKMEGIDAVIDKDYASARLMLLFIEAGLSIDLVDKFIIATEVDKVALNYGKPDSIHLDKISLEDAKQYISQGQFPDGNMGPKVRAVSATHSRGIPSYIVGLDKLDDIKSGTEITGDRQTIEGDMLKYWVDFGR